MSPWMLSLAVLVGSVAVVGPAHPQQLVIRDSEAASYIGQTLTVEGTVASVHTTRSGTTFLNFGAAYPKQTFTAVIFRSGASQFSNPQQWEGKRVRITGKVRLYRDRPGIVLESPSQLTLAPATLPADY
jgi:DNA/RNA endonuclease YhcR with UshA esterase domain